MPWEVAASHFKAQSQPTAWSTDLLPAWLRCFGGATGAEEQETMPCRLASKSTHQHLRQTDLHCLKSVEGMKKNPHQLCTYQYIEPGPGLAKKETIALLSGRVFSWFSTLWTGGKEIINAVHLCMHLAGRCHVTPLCLATHCLDCLRAWCSLD